MEVTYYVALPFVGADDGIAAGEAVECINPNAAGCEPRRYRVNPATSARSPLVAAEIRRQAISGMQR
jgi:hypothetical protein